MTEHEMKTTEDNHAMRGQSIIEYALIMALLGIALGLAIAAAGPRVGNTFENVVFNLLQQTPEGEGRPVTGPVDFWLTVTWTNENELQEQPLPTRTEAAPSTTPTLGPSPTPSPVTPTRTPVPSNTPIPTPTPLDITVVAPFVDESDPYENTVSNPEHWRIGGGAFFGYDGWCGNYYPSMRPAGSSVELCNEELGVSGDTLDFDWDGGSPIEEWPSGNVGNEFSVVWTREILIEDDTMLTFIAGGDDGYRVWVDYSENCAATGGVNNPPNSGDNSTGNDRTFGDPDDHCLLIDDWNNQGYDINSVSRTFTVDRDGDGNPIPKTVEIRMDYYENSGDAAAMLVIRGGSVNPDDTVVDNGGNPTGDDILCNWGRTDSDNSNTETWMWEEYVNGDFPRNARCHLEFRGYVYVPDGLSDPPEVTELINLDPNDQYRPLASPEMVFWDVWEFDNGVQSAWLEIAEYVEQSPGVVNRPALNWQRINLRQGNTQNYNWTRNVVDLTNVNGIDYRGLAVTFRFVMQNGDSGSTRRWYIDDVEFRDRTIRGLNGVPAFTISAPTADPDAYVSYWDMEDPNADRQDFITSGRWDITGRNARDIFGWDDSPESDYADHSQSPDWSTDTDDMRIHYLEFNGWVDVSGTQPDFQGDTGEPLLSFYQGYKLDRYTGLEIQYTTDPYGVGPANWQVVPGGDAGDPEGMIRSWTEGNDNVNRESLQFTEVELGEIPATRFRLRFAMIVRGSAREDEGWWIDDIRLERVGLPTYLDYPFFDSGEVGMDNWLPSGSWWRTNEVAYEGFHAFTDSPGPGVNYIENTNSTLTTIDPIDMYNDTPGNLALTDRNPAGGNSHGMSAVDPVMTFMHFRDLERYDNFHVQWRRYDESDTEWKPLWSYIFRMTTESNRDDWDSGTQIGWERVEIDMSPIMDALNANDDPGNTTDDDILLRFRLYSDGSRTGDGVWIDSIRIEERQERVHRLWPTIEDRTVGGENFGVGNGTRYAEDVDAADWWRSWYAGGGWLPIEFTQHNGLRSFHESTTYQVAAPYTPIVDYNSVEGRWSAEAVNVLEPSRPPEDITLTETRHDTFNVLELSTIFDLRATEVSEDPMLFFWTRYHVGRSDRISVEISYELDPDEVNIADEMNNRCGGNRPSCYEQLYGWSEWREVWSRDNWSKTWTWEREQVSLVDYASNGSTPGDRIRVRFVYDALENSDNRDGWYIDDVYVEHRELDVLATLPGEAFYDPARNMNNWVAEGEWGLSPELFFPGRDGGAVQLGLWQETFWDCDDCDDDFREPGTNWRNRFASGADVFLDSDGSIDPSRQSVSRLVPYINYDIGDGAPRPGIFDHENEFVARWTLDTPVIGTSGVAPGSYTFITVSDDGIRMKLEEIDGNGNVINPAPPSLPDSVTWNVIYNWNDHGPMADIGVVDLELGKRYRVTIEWYDRGGGAMAVVTTGGNAFSFTDSPKLGSGPAFLDRPSVPFSNSSLILDGIIDLTDPDIDGVVMEYYTFYEIDGRARVEVSRDGGFSWENGTLDDNGYDDPDWNWGTELPSEGDDWQQRQHTLDAYIGDQIMIRFRFDRQGRGDGNGQNDGLDDMSTDGPNWWDNANFNENGFFVGWWITEIRIAGI